jgi:membrane protease YdiL (CAAX protease family)
MDDAAAGQELQDVPSRPPQPSDVARPPRRAAALVEVLLCSGFPTQLVIIGIMRMAGMRPETAGGGLSLAFFGTLALADSILLISLIVFFLRAGNESPRALFLGTRPPAHEAALGAALIPAVFIFVAVIVGSLRLIAPWLHTVPQNPLGALLDSPAKAVVFGFVVVIAGGLREEIQRAFILHRFEQSLGGATLGLVLFSVMFGLGHIEQGADIAIATATLGVIWGAVYLWRRSVVAPAVSHAGFNLAQVIVQAAVRGSA